MVRSEPSRSVSVATAFASAKDCSVVQATRGPLNRESADAGEQEREDHALCQRLPRLVAQEAAEPRPEPVHARSRAFSRSSAKAAVAASASCQGSETMSGHTHRPKSSESL